MQGQIDCTDAHVTRIDDDLVPQLRASLDKVHGKRMTREGVEPQYDFEPTLPVMRHPNSARFHELLKRAGDLHDRKQADYGRGADPFANIRASVEWGIPAWVGAMVRLNDKIRRLQSLATKGELMNESALDSFDDIAVYAIIARVLYEQETESK